MQLAAHWRSWRNRRLFAAVGSGCRLDGINLEVKGHVELGAGCVVRNNVVFRSHDGGQVLVEAGVELSDYVLILANSQIRIREGAYIGPHCVIRDTNHMFHGTDIHWRLTPHIVQPIEVGSKAYVGGRSYLMPQVHIGEGALVAPGSIVTKDIGPYEIWGGSPARLIAHRTDPEKRSSLKRDLALLHLFGMAPESGPPKDTEAH